MAFLRFLVATGRRVSAVEVVNACESNLSAVVTMTESAIGNDAANLAARSAVAFANLPNEHELREAFVLFLEDVDAEQQHRQFRLGVFDLGPELLKLNAVRDWLDFDEVLT